MKKQPSTGKAVIWGLIVGILIGWIPLIGALLTGMVAGKKARTTRGAFIAALFPAALYGGGLYWLSTHPIKIGKEQMVIGEFLAIGIITVACMIGSAMMAARPGLGRLFGLIAVIGGLSYAGFEAPAIYSAGKAITTLAQKPPEVAKSTGTSCPDNLRALYNAALNYADGHDGKLPPADKWVDELKANVTDEELRCPDVATAGYGYSMNPALGGKSVESISNKAGTALFFDSTDTGVNAHSGLDSVPKPGRHDGQNNIVFLDGHLESVAP